MQNHTKRDSVVCTLYEARAQGMQTYSIKQQEDLRMGFFRYQPQCAFAQILNVTPGEHVSTHFGGVPKGCILSCQLSDYESCCFEATTKCAPQLTPWPVAAVCC